MSSNNLVDFRAEHAQKNSVQIDPNFPNQYHIYCNKGLIKVPEYTPPLPSGAFATWFQKFKILINQTEIK